MTQSPAVSRPLNSRRRSFVGLVTLAAFVASLPGCSSVRYKPVALKQMEVDRDQLVKRRLRLTRASRSSVTLEVTRVDFPFIWGKVVSGDRLMQVRTDEIQAMALVSNTGRDASASARFAPFLLNDLGDLSKKTRKVALRTAGGDIWMEATKLGGGELEGKALDRMPARFDLRQATQIETGESDAFATVTKVVGVTGAVFGGILLIAILTKESCPFVYVDRGNGMELVGEAYPGAAFRSVQRDDLLSLGSVGEGDVHVRLRNEARETQFTDRAELIVVDHSSGLEAVATPDARVVLLRDSTPPASAEVEGADVTADLTEPDGRFWERDVVRASNASTRPAGDSVVVDLKTPAAFGSSTPEALALDLQIGNTPLVDLVFGRFFAAMGQNLKTFVSKGNAAGSGTRINNWLTREGVRLTVEVDDGTGFRRVATISPTGPARTRRIAVPLDVPTGTRSLRARLRGGVGFWRFDAIRLASIAREATHATTVTATRAISSRQGTAVDLVAAVDQVHNALETLDETLDLTFRPPPPRPGLDRTMLLLTTGYYNVHPPIESRRQFGLLYRVRDRPGSLSQLGLDLVQDYVRAARTTPMAGDTGGPR